MISRLIVNTVILIYIIKFLRNVNKREGERQCQQKMQVRLSTWVFMTPVKFTVHTTTLLCRYMSYDSFIATLSLTFLDT